VAVQQTTLKSLRALLAAPILLLAFLIASYHLTRESLWDDEAYTIWFIHDEGRPPEGIVQTAQFIRSSLSNTLARIRVDVHPPLYFLTLDVWTLLTGESIYTVRLLSALFGLVALAATYAVSTHLFDHQTAFIAVIILATASFFIYYTREARMYMLLIALTSLSTWAYLRWQRQKTRLRTVIYGILMAALLYTHYVGALIIVTQIIHGLLVGAWRAMPARRVFDFFLPYALAVILYIPWIPVLANQMRLQGGPSALPIPSDWGAILALLLILTSGNWGLYAAPFVLGSALLRIRQHGSALILLMLWLLITPLTLLVINVQARPIFQIRYTIAILPAWALLVAYGLRFSGQLSAVSFQQNTKNAAQRRNGAEAQKKAIYSVFSVTERSLPVGLWFKIVLPAALVIWLAYTQLTMYTEFWPDKPRWDEAIRQMTAIRQPLEPAITSITPQSPAAYYDRIYGIRRGIALDLSWRWQESDDMRRYVAHVVNAPSVWTVMPSNFVSTWDAVAELLNSRHIGYRDTVMNLIFYRFDSGTGDGLHFRFSDALAYDGGIGQQLYALTGAPFCFDMTMTALKPLENEKIEWQLTQGYGTVRAALTAEIGAHPTGDSIKFSPCIDIPSESPLGPHHLRVSIRDNSELFPLIESKNLYWGEQLVLAQVSVSAGQQLESK
jgi:4-amino-4-deoxy-L-arabinose transferase-like glycosyltransferase